MARVVHVDFVKSKQCIYFLTLITLMHIGNGEKTEPIPERKHTDIILIGGMGDLSKKYLLNGFFNLITKHNNDIQTFSFYPSGRTTAESTETVLSAILDSKINCGDKDGDGCLKAKKSFLKVTNYVQLKTEDDYQVFCNKLKIQWKNTTEGKLKRMTEVIFYLSIPSSGYLSTAHFINKHCRLKHENLNLKVVMEKPFGHDKLSAQEMSLVLSDSFSEEEIYRVDHYLGKTIAREILNFRCQNENVEALLNQNHVDHVEIVMKETIGVKGRIEFYDQTGVIKDVFQNHLTELLILVSMEMPQDPTSSSAINVNKLRLLTQIEPITLSNTLLGQYSDYMEEAEKEGAQLQKSRFTPTFAATVLKIKSPRWDGVPFVLAGGKKLDERSGYIRVVFKRNTVCVKKCDDKRLQQVVFHIGHGELSSPAIVMSTSLGQPIWPPGFMTNSSNPLPAVLYGQPSDDVHVGFPISDPDAYTVLIEDLFLGVQDKFIGTDHLLALWNIWSDIAATSSSVKPRVYTNGDENRTLEFRFMNKGIEFVKPGSDSVSLDSNPAETRQTPSTYLGYKLITSNRQRLAYLLAKHIADSIHKTLKVTRLCNIAFSGGKSPAILFETLAQHFADIPWKYVHIWQVDERCVPPTDKDSNFRQLETHLLKYINVPHYNIHPMPVDIASKLCSPQDNAAELYHELLEDQVGEQGLDFVVLGVGSDGHTASIFPNSQTLKETVKLTALTDINQGASGRQRITLTLRAINEARQVSVFVIGKDKQGILKELEEKKASVNEYPILGVKPKDGSLTWFIDEEAYFR